MGGGRRKSGTDVGRRMSEVENVKVEDRPSRSLGRPWCFGDGCLGHACKGDGGVFYGHACEGEHLVSEANALKHPS